MLQKVDEPAFRALIILFGAFLRYTMFPLLSFFFTGNVIHSDFRPANGSRSVSNA